MKIILPLVAYVLLSFGLSAQTWNGSSSSDWFTAANWTPSGVPSNSASVTIPASLSTYPVLTGNVVVGGLSMASGSSIGLASYSLTDSGNVSLTGATISGGGNFTVLNSSGALTVSGCTITATFSVINYRSSCNIINNTIVGNTLIADSSVQTSGVNYIDGNAITGNLNLVHAANGSTSYQMAEGYNGTSGNVVSGNVDVQLKGIGDFYSSYSHPIYVGGNFTITRTVSGLTSVYRTTAPGTSVGGNFSLTSSGGAIAINGSGNDLVNVVGTFNVSAPSVGATFSMYSMKNNTAGGTVSVNAASTVNVRNDTLKTTFNLTEYTYNCYVFDNSITGTTTIGDAATQTSGSNYIDGNLITGDFTLNHKANGSASYEMLEGYASPSGNGNRIVGNATFNISGVGNFYSSYSHALNVTGNLTVNRNVFGQTILFRTIIAGTTIGGDFSLATIGGNTYLGTSGNPMMSILGKFDIAAPNLRAPFTMYSLKNATAGGNVSVNAATTMDVRNDTLKSDIALTQYTYTSYVVDNSFTGNTSIADSSSNTSGSNYIDGNLFTGNLFLRHAANGSTSYDMTEGQQSPSGNGNRVTGNADFKIDGKGDFKSSYTHPLVVGGNLSIVRDSIGYTSLYNTTDATSSVGGDFSFYTAGGTTVINGPQTAIVTVAGTFNITAPKLRADFTLHRMKNATAGGAVSVNAAASMDVRNDTLKSNVALTQYTYTSYVVDNSFTGNTSIADSSTNTSGSNYIDGNLFTGNLFLRHSANGSTSYDMTEGQQSPSGNGNRVTGNADFKIDGKGNFYSSYAHPLVVGGNLNIVRDSIGYTNLYNTTDTTSSVGGDFSFYTAGGTTVINGPQTAVVTVAGTFNITAPKLRADFTLHRMKNATAGGAVSVNAAASMDVRNDTLKSNVALTQYTYNGYVLDNSFTGNTTIADSSTNTSSSNFIDGNLFTGNLFLRHSAHGSTSYDMTEGQQSPSGNGNRVTGNADFKIDGKGNFYSSYAHPLVVGGNLNIVRDSIGYTNLYNTTDATSTVGGDFSLSTKGGSTSVNGSGGAMVNVAGTFNIDAPSLGAPFTMYKMRNTTSGGLVSVVGATSMDIRNDTLVTDINFKGMTSSFYIYNNQFTGNTFLADDPTQSGNEYFDDNLMDGNFTLEHNATSTTFYDGYGGAIGYGNRVTGIDSIVNKSGAAAISLSYSHRHQADSTFVLNAPSGVVLHSLAFGGATNGNLRQVNTQGFSIPIVDIKKSGRATLILDSFLIVSNVLNFSGGFISSTPAHPLTFGSGAIYTGASDSSHATGFVQKVGSTAFTFPTGDTDHLSPCAISAPGVATDTFSAQYIAVAPGFSGYDSTLKDASINHLSRREYWLIDRGVSSSSNVKVTLGFVRNNSGIVSNQSELTVAHWYGSPAKWHDEGNGGTTGTNNLGTITTTNTISTFSPFTLASTTIANSLPIQVAQFDVQKVAEAAKITWTSSTESGIAQYEVEHSTDGQHFGSIASIVSTPDAENHSYRYDDAAPAMGINFYRIAVVSTVGSRYYTATKALNFSASAHEDIAIYPNPTTNEITIQAGADWQGASVQIRDVTGRIQQQATLPQDAQLHLQLNQLPAGIYNLELKTDKQRVIRAIIKQ